MSSLCGDIGICAIIRWEFVRDCLIGVCQPLAVATPTHDLVYKQYITALGLSFLLPNPPRFGP